MSFLVVISTLIAERFLLRFQHWRRFYWLERWMELQQSLPVAQPLRRGALGLASLLLPLLLLVALLQWLLSGVAFGIPYFLFSALVLLYCLGPADLDRQVSELLEANDSGNLADLHGAIAQLTGKRPDSQNPDYSRTTAEGIFISAQQRIFAVLFWFVLLGPLGAAAYRLTRQIQHAARQQQRQNLLDPIHELLFLLDWLPAHMTAGLFALAGAFETTLKSWRACGPEQNNESALAKIACAGAGALQLDDKVYAEDSARGPDPSLVESAMALVWRSIALLVIVLGVIAVTAWIS
jgi:membrane protein required for beta-lactamase induction